MNIKFINLLTSMQRCNGGVMLLFVLVELLCVCVCGIGSVEKNALSIEMGVREKNMNKMTYTLEPINYVRCKWREYSWKSDFEMGFFFSCTPTDPIGCNLKDLLCVNRECKQINLMNNCECNTDVLAKWICQIHTRMLAAFIPAAERRATDSNNWDANIYSSILWNLVTKPLFIDTMDALCGVHFISNKIDCYKKMVIMLNNNHVPMIISLLNMILLQSCSIPCWYVADAKRVSGFSCLSFV